MGNRQQEIAALAYEMHLNRGCLDGHEMHDWLEAERIIAARHLARKAITAGISASTKKAALKEKGTGAKKKATTASAVSKKTDIKKAAPKRIVAKKAALKTTSPKSKKP